MRSLFHNTLLMTSRCIFALPGQLYNLHVQDAYSKATGPRPNLEKEVLMFLWYIGNLESFRSMADRFGISKGSFHASIKRVSSALLEILPEVVKWPETPAEINETSQHFGRSLNFRTL